MPLYEKSHSWGEFVFDWAWAQAYERAGLNYYPKLVSAVPFTPAQSTRLLLRDPDDNQAAKALLSAALKLADETDCSSLHVQFPAASDISVCEDLGLKIRKDCQFHWHNQNYADFEAFLKTFSSRKRKKVRQDRRRVTDAGITFRRLHGQEMTATLWSVAYQLISITFMRRGSMPYFDLSFFESVARDLADNILVIFAERQEQPIAAAIFFEGANTLYGRYWGSDAHYDALHFETCYYQGIDYCIEHGISRFEPGTQGEHKISRGFSPVSTYSAHWLQHPEFFSAIERFLEQEEQHIDRYIDAVEDHSPFRQTDPQ